MNVAVSWATFSRSLKTITTSIRRSVPIQIRGVLISPASSGAELFSVEQLEQHARQIASQHQVTWRWGLLRPLRAALTRDERDLLRAYRALAEDAHQRKQISPAAEWLLDNFHLVGDQIREIRQDLPGGYYRELPKLVAGPHAGRPRVYAIAYDLIAHSDGKIDQERLLRYILAYQSVAPLTIGELWAIPIMLRFGLVENLARLARLLLDVRSQYADADAWAERLLSYPDGSVETNPVLAELVQHHPHLLLPFAVQLLRRLRSYDGERDVSELIVWLERQLPSASAEDLVHVEHQRQATAQVSVGNTITSMRTLNAIDWAIWFEQVSHVEQVLRQDPAGVYAASTFTTRDRYRHEIERLADRSGHSEDDVARQLLEQAMRALRREDEPRHTQVGYYLLGDGRTPFEALLGYQAAPSEVARRALLRQPTPFYLGAIAGFAGAGITAALRLAFHNHKQPGHANLAMQMLGAGLVALPASAFATELVNRIVTRLLEPRLLPRLDLRQGIPAELRTIVVVPTLLLTPDSVRHQLDALEVLYLANQDPHLHFALLSDFADAPQPTMPEDAVLLEVARERVEVLNARYGSDRFLLLHRKRVWNERQGCWMGWERKRGKLDEFNALLAGAADTTYELLLGDLRVLPLIRYVITLDADTQLPRDAAQALIGTLAHPLNAAVVDPQTRRTVQGYGILQPRVGIDLPSATASHFARIFAGNVGIDPYTTAVSDAYMDLFGEGIFVGKGIYDPQVMRQTLYDRFPDNTLLSHDLIEGNYARAALLSDVELIDSYPTTYAAYAARQHRWVRGDWQIAGWLLPRVPTVAGPLAANVLPPIARYKIFDNLRRSLVPPASLALLAAGWLYLPGKAWAWTLAALGHLGLPLLFELIELRAWLTFRRSPVSLRLKIQALGFEALRLLINVALLPDQAVLNLDAIVRTLSRVLVTRRRLLEWETAAQAQRRLRSSSGRILRRSAPALALLASLGATRVRRLVAALPAAAPVLSCWLSAPTIAAWLDRPYTQETAQPIQADDLLLLRNIARTTWAYFERFVSEDGNYLAPDNFQETPAPLVAPRTSPTNIGLQLLADLSACDFGYIGLGELTVRSERVFATLEQLEYYRGHLLNWYDTRTLKPLPPLYVSTVDSGNLAGHLLTLAQAYQMLQEQPIIGPHVVRGLQDTLALLRDSVPADDLALAQIEALDKRLGSPPTSIAGYREVLRDTLDRVANLRLTGLAAEWANALVRQAQSQLDDLDALTRTLPTEAGEAIPSLAALAVYGGYAESLLARQVALIELARELALGMDFRFLYDETRRIFAIGYNVSDGRRDNSFYDLLASESRLASFVAIAKGDVPKEHWFHIGRTLTPAAAPATLIAWSGTMFEYLMPLLVMRSYPETLLDSTIRGAVAAQIAYGAEQDLPWGISESAYNSRDLAMNYQYRAFGVPGLGLKSGLANDQVVAPYATLLALPIAPTAALENIRRLIALGMWGAYGLYEAIDYTRDRLPPGATQSIVRSFMVHHQGMSLVVLDNLLNDNIMQQRFHQEPIVKATEPLLYEKIPQSAPIQLPEQAVSAPVVITPAAPTSRQFASPGTSLPYTHLIGSGAYSVLLTNAGSGASFYKGLAVTRWRADATRDCWGSFFYIRDVRSGLAWSAGYQPLRHEPQSYRAVFSLEKAEFQQQIGGIETRMEVTVSPEDACEVRRITLTNLSAAPRQLEITSYAEVVLAPPMADLSHPAFSNLFVETEFLADRGALLASRRPRAANVERPYAVHVVATRSGTIGAVEYETNRLAFLGRGRTHANPLALDQKLGGGVGAVLDPIFSLRRQIRIAPGSSVQLLFTTAVGATRDEALRLADKYRDPVVAARAFDLAWTQAQVELQNLNMSSDAAHRFQRLATFALFPDLLRRAPAEVIRRNCKGQPGLWAYGISGDDPVILVRVAAASELPIIQELLQAHEYWRLKGLRVELAILNEDASGYMQGLQEQVLAIIRSGRAGGWLNQRGGIFVLRTDVMPEEDRVLVETVARVVLVGRRGNLAQHLRRRDQDTASLPRLLPSPPTGSVLPPVEPLAAPGAYGGFAHDGSEYLIELGPGQQTPAPWINVVANQHFGFIVSERGASYTWAENSRENRLTPWANDPVSDPAGEAIYLRDESDGQVWSPTPWPLGAGHFRVRHGFGYSTFEHRRHGIASKLTLSVPPDEPVKLLQLELTNEGAAERNLSLTFCVEWVLGVFREQMAPYVITEIDEELGALLARNPYNHEFAAGVAFIAASEASSFSGDRAIFVGRNADLSSPQALLRAGSLSGKVGAGYDPCGALRCDVRLGPSEQRTIVLQLGQAQSLDEARDLITRYRDPAAASAARERTIQHWEAILGQVQVRTPRPEMDLLLNGWLLYQTLACRIWARSAFYQSGGAYGFRDQLQDVLALLHAAPEVARAQILRSAARQFVEGDVQHWWHPPTGRGIRTNFSDDYLWLPFVSYHYVRATDDTAILDEVVPFLEGRPLAEGEDEYYDHPTISARRASLYEHCARTVDRALERKGAHGLPLMGSGDWNDGMNLVGAEGRGESIWVGWFLVVILRQFAQLTEERGNAARAAHYREQAEGLLHALEATAWDGNWYLRAFYDDGSPLGSAENLECRLDSLAQSWAVIAGGDPTRARQAMQAVAEHLIDREVGLIQLFTPPFDRSQQNPGYIKGYLPGVRENGGQYTHGIIWVIWAYALLGMGDEAAALFNLISPLRLANSDPTRYKVEPYVMAADVYAAEQHRGQGGWTWYTGSAGWFYRLGLEMILGLRREGTTLFIKPCVPPDWSSYQVSYRYGSSCYHIRVENQRGPASLQVTLDGAILPDERIPLLDDGQTHEVLVRVTGD